MINLDDAKVVLTEQKKKLKADLVSTPARISELKNQVADIVEPDDKELDRLKSKLEQLKAYLDGIRNNEDSAKLRQELSEIKSKIAELNSQMQTAALSARGPIIEKIKALQTDAMQLERQIADLNGQVEADEKRNKIATEAMDKLRSDYISEKALKPLGDDTCHACGQPLPPDQIQAATDRFNKAQAEKLKKINAEGLTLKAGVDARTKEIAAAQGGIKKAQGRLDEINGQIADLEKSLEATPQAKPNPEIKALEQEAARLEGLIAAGKNGSAIRERDTQEKIDDIQSQIDAWKKQQAEYEAAGRSRARVKELLAQEKNLNAELEDVEHKLYLIDRFTTQKVKLLEAKINDMFAFAQFRMFKTLVNGTIQPCCEVLCDGVPFEKGLNTAARINTGLDIIQVLGDHFGMRLPVWVDNAESINELHKIDAQVIALAVTDDPELVVNNLS